MVRGIVRKLALRALSVAGRCQHQHLRRADQHLRRANIYEYQGTEFVKNYGINMPRGAAAWSVQQVKEDQGTEFVRNYRINMPRGMATWSTQQVKEDQVHPHVEITADKPGASDAKLSYDDYLALRQKEIFGQQDTTEDNIKVNPPVEITVEKPVAPDAKLKFDDYLELRQKEIFGHRDTTEDPIKGEPEPTWCGDIGEDGLPTWVDWTVRGAVTPVQDQIFSGPCWAFATIGAIEGSNFIYTGKLVKLSEQQLIDCNDVNNYGMESGLTMEAFEYVKRCGGVASAAEYPYVAKQQRPHKHLTTDLVTITGYKVVTPDCEQDLKKAVSICPVAASIEYTRGFKNYDGGVLSGPNSRLRAINHAVLVVGYGPFEGVDAWKVKDSEGEEKGPYGGYVYITRNVYEAGGTLGIARYCVQPTKRKHNSFGPVRSETEMGVKKAWVRSIDTFYQGNPS